MNISTKAVIISDEGKILSLKCSPNDTSRPNTWDLPGGKLEENEDPKEGIVREIREETQLEITDLELLDIVSGVNKAGEYWIGVGFKAKTNTTNVILSSEHGEFGWFTKEEFSKLESVDKFMHLVEKI